MRQFGKVEIPQEAFIAALKMDGIRVYSDPKQETENANHSI